MQRPPTHPPVRHNISTRCNPVVTSERKTHHHPAPIHASITNTHRSCQPPPPHHSARGNKTRPHKDHSEAHCIDASWAKPQSSSQHIRTPRSAHVVDVVRSFRPDQTYMTKQTLYNIKQKLKQHIYVYSYIYRPPTLYNHSPAPCGEHKYILWEYILWLKDMWGVNVWNEWGK